MYQHRQCDRAGYKIDISIEKIVTGYLVRSLKIQYANLGNILHHQCSEEYQEQSGGEISNRRGARIEQNRGLRDQH